MERRTLYAIIIVVVIVILFLILEWFGISDLIPAFPPESFT
ncbi:MAG: hypothetical protein ThorAB25_17370 [Candidatus Thorarchaeota archaeon AB_25]|jgi:hypothetical protein|nr:MAG: hypothetical protein ThorAB25_17370 [Candidatus Thorarchaeota archaeon AB_25]